MIALLDLPLELPLDAPARKAGLTLFTSGLPEYLARCTSLSLSLTLSLIRYIDLPSLISWLSARQYAPEGGFSGRTNKLVDGCYSHWVGGCWPLIQQALSDPTSDSESESDCEPLSALYSREGLTRYILNCCQSQHGGLRDKPGNVQHRHVNVNSNTSIDASSGSLDAAFGWRSSPLSINNNDAAAADTVYEARDRLAALHPLFVIPHAAVDAIHSWCRANPISI
ncbi:Rab geranylgeranyltransferase, beta subunit [Trichophyton verrucosum HKI 0517]|uniref:Rab geranylgeranyltransferase, beta subunit n=1 Tax=Trichophyton verrucosum (strain HKI 0517) TaxID=663202 RepID=D4DGE4_TRIVH|nr:Rab geranylgeranyltransferase, beta subunit [Trichophyton verrucosum HKI 0517]EFE39077.1 Rab geranylgeranyltransferase, beta subunit [Trichophyton verrucosum HKI 0517]